MNTVTTDSERPKRNLTWQPHQPPGHCDHQYEVLAHMLGDALKRCTKCGALEAR